LPGRASYCTTTRVPRNSVAVLDVNSPSRAHCELTAMHRPLSLARSRLSPLTEPIVIFLSPVLLRIAFRWRLVGERRGSVPCGRGNAAARVAMFFPEPRVGT
ncbi:MAG: hypothetical protein AAF346_08180, partial [Pseudomonadota bacterium]